MFDQSPYECRMEWGQRGAREAAERGDITIIVDVLSFSSTVTAAVNAGAVVYPHPPPANEAAGKYAAELGAELVRGRAEAAKSGGHSLSPLSFGPNDSGSRFVLCSLNGAACSWAAAKVPALFVGCLLNGAAVARAANDWQRRTGAAISVIACGERWSSPQNDENNIRPCIEDYLGAGLILSQLSGSKSPEAAVCIGAFGHARAGLEPLLWDCGSARELREWGYGQDVAYCLRQDVFDVAPMLKEGRFGT